jgi:hypothetical protein
MNAPDLVIQFEIPVFLVLAVIFILKITYKFTAQAPVHIHVQHFTASEHEYNLKYVDLNPLNLSHYPRPKPSLNTGSD